MPIIAVDTVCIVVADAAAAAADGGITGALNFGPIADPQLCRPSVDSVSAEMEHDCDVTDFPNVAGWETESYALPLFVSSVSVVFLLAFNAVIISSNNDNDDVDDDDNNNTDSVNNDCVFTSLLAMQLGGEIVRSIYRRQNRRNKIMDRRFKAHTLKF